MKTLVLAISALALFTAARAAAQTTPPDVVHLANGGVVRGTLVEQIPGDHVTVQLATGETRTFPAAEVQSVELGAAHVAPPPVVPPAPAAALTPPDDGLVELHVRATRPHLRVQGLLGSGSLRGPFGSTSGITADVFRPICEAPCDTRIRPGVYTLGVSDGDGTARRAERPMADLRHGGTVEIDYDNREAFRLTGWVLMVAGLVTALSASFLLPSLSHGATDADLFGLLGLSIGGLVVEFIGLGLINLNDRADVRVVPTAPR